MINLRCRYNLNLINSSVIYLSTSLTSALHFLSPKFTPYQLVLFYSFLLSINCLLLRFSIENWKQKKFKNYAKEIPYFNNKREGQERDDWKGETSIHWPVMSDIFHVFVFYLTKVPKTYFSLSSFLIQHGFFQNKNFICILVWYCAVLWIRFWNWI